MGSFSPLFRLKTSVLMFPLPSSFILRTYLVPLGKSYYSIVVVIGTPFSNILLVVVVFLVSTPFSIVWIVEVFIVSPF